MKKRIICAVFSIVLLISLCLNASAAINANRYYKATLSFSGNSAKCALTVRETGKSINATLELWQGTTKIGSWTQSGTSVVYISASHSATSGQSYTVKAHGTIGGVPFTATSVTKTCP